MVIARERRNWPAMRRVGALQPYDPPALPSYTRRGGGALEDGGSGCGAPAACGPAVLTTLLSLSEVGWRSDKGRLRSRGTCCLRSCRVTTFRPLRGGGAAFGQMAAPIAGAPAACRPGSLTAFPFLGGWRGCIRTNGGLGRGAAVAGCSAALRPCFSLRDGEVALGQNGGSGGGIGCLLPCRVTTFFPLRDGEVAFGQMVASVLSAGCRRLTILPPYYLTNLLTFVEVGAARVLAGEFESGSSLSGIAERALSDAGRCDS